ncbi:hypothetical protein ZYGR_0W00500 [Zygosaccharomyces rouxii]|uniref:PSP1 C-terminal domain-containing protein n=1 Tax=Zygosaccharomyces rouxii TaxID=4956 RepID=A0A1Q3A479_ZYGRO|nr:hypothetical protein ZYGR_0W00500 [Zygosaccharomyces rouxii]
MTTELPSINSTTSISDNADLRNYYENLLFKNSSGRSLADLPRGQEFSQQSQQDSPRSRNQQRILQHHQQQQNPQPQQQQQRSQNQHNPENTVDFINGFHASNGSPFHSFRQAPSMTPSNSEPVLNSPTADPLSQQQQQQQQQLYQQAAAQQQAGTSATTASNPTAAAAAAAAAQQQSGRHSMFYTPQDPLGSMGGFTLDFDRNNNRNSSVSNDASATYAGYTKQSVSPGSMVSSLNADPFFDLPPIFQQHREPLEERKQQYLGARRSSYISDTLIHGNLASFMGANAPPPPPTTATTASMAAPPTATMFPTALDPTEAAYPLGPFAAPANPPSMPTTAGPMGAPLSDVPDAASQVRSLTTAPAAMYGGFLQPQMLQQLPPRRNTQPVNSLATPPISAPFKTSAAPLGARNRYLNFSKSNQQQQPQQQNPQQQLHQNQHQPRRQSQQHGQQVSPHQQDMPIPPTAAVAAAAMNGNAAGQVPLDNGLVLVNGQRIASSPDLQALYADCGSKYFSGGQVYDFADYIKSMLNPAAGDQDDLKKQSIFKFLAFLKSCNLNYNAQSDAFVSGEKQSHMGASSRKGSGNGNDPTAIGNQDRRPSTASTYLHYKPLVLVSLKNGKLELLSTPQNTNILMQRGDLVIIDGDRGKDLALVVEPVVDLDLALFVNFLKKKIHFDSLITSRSQHHPNNRFVHSLIQSTKGQSEELNSKLYDVIELTQLIVPSKQVLRFATPWEITTNLHNKFQDELKALHIAQLKLKSLNSGFSHHHHGHGHGHAHGNEHIITTTTAANNNENGSPNANNGNGNSVGRPQLNIKILNAEFQFDRKKLTFYYFCEERNDFRELIKELFKFYKTRIWLCAIPNNLGIDQKYYNSQRKELKMYQEMMQHYAVDDLADANAQQGAGFIVAPALNKIELDNFQIGVYKELVNELFGN